MLAGADEESDADADAEADVDGEVVAEVGGDVVGDVVVGCVAGDEYVLVGCDGGGAAGEDVLGDADGSVVAELTAGPTEAGAGAEDVCPAGCSSWMDGCPENEVSANAAAPPAPTRPPRISATTSGFIRRRGGRPVPDGMGVGIGGGVAGG
ncbi:MAG TPA: hypothetical protein VE888_08635 [Streptosporangiaceae bacterium]|nr:hypothetical protein [Streptosporangiaceae bacterium]